MPLNTISAIAIDWGSSNFRAYLLNESYQTITTIKMNEGIKKHHHQAYAPILQRLLQPWIKEITTQSVPIFMAGMIGSNLGWHETPYLACPLILEHLSKHLYTFDSPWHTPLHIVPGVKIDSQQKMDIMRGEETLILGAHELFPSTHYCLPGTHSKWATLEEDILMSFTTVITGELYAILKEHSLLGFELPIQDYDEKWFYQGIETIKRNNKLLIELFSVRAKRILNQLPANSAMSYLSGLLIGDEINSMLMKTDPLYQRIALVTSAKAITMRYRNAFQLLEVPIQILDGEQAFIKGMTTLIRRRKQNEN